MTKIENIANFFINIANKTKDDNITNLKLNKLLYFSQGEYLSKFDLPIFNEKIEAWKYGPVVPMIYNKYKVLGNQPILEADEDYNQASLERNVITTLIDVYYEFGKYTGSALINLTHLKGSPWQVVYKEGFNNEIPIDLIKDYFLKHYNKKSDDKNKIKVLPRDWYYQEEDRIWEQYL